jgi:hypothetical protein
LPSVVVRRLSSVRAARRGPSSRNPRPPPASLLPPDASHLVLSEPHEPDPE